MPCSAFAVIMAGGKGTRFWPESREARPKQFLPLLSDDTMIGQTIQRLSGLFAPENIVIVTNRCHVDLLRSMFPAIPPENILGEPEGRNTAPCMAMAYAHIKNVTEQMTEQVTDPVLAFFPADHAIEGTPSFCETLRACVERAAAPDTIVTIGITPQSPHTGYGYIELAEPAGKGFHRSAGFREKPDAITAQRYLEAGKFRWNAGMFFLSAATLHNSFQKYAPELAVFSEELRKRMKENRNFDDLYHTAPKISIDYAVMEHAAEILVADAPFTWDDVGSWTSLRNRIEPDENGNRVRGKFAGLDVKDCIVINRCNSGKEHLVAAIGVTDLVVIHTDDATLICPAKDAQRITELVNRMNDNPDYQDFT